MKPAAKNIPLVCCLHSDNEQICSGTDLIPALCTKFWVQSTKWFHWVNIRAGSRLRWQNGGCRLALVTWAYFLVLCPDPMTKGPDPFWIYVGFECSPEHCSPSFPVKFKEKHVTAVVHLGSKMPLAWKRMDYLDIRESSRGSFKLSYYVQLEDSGRLFLFFFFFLITLLYFYFLPRHRSVNSFSSPAWFILLAVSLQSQRSA